MIGGLSRTGRLAVAAIFCAVGGAPGTEERAEAADLEERVADLEATTVRKGNKKISVELYGRVNRQINFWDDGSESNAYVLNNSYSTTRFGIRGKGKTGVSDVNAIYVIEIEQFADQTRFANQFNDNPDVNTQLRVRKSAIGLDSKKYGRIWLGLQEMAKDNINKDTVVIKGLEQTMTQDFYNNWSFFLRPKGFKGAEGMSNIRYQDIARCYSTGSSAFDCSTRRNEARYDTPELWGFTGSASWGEDDIWSASVRYQKEWDNWKVGAGYAYEDFTDELVNNGGGVQTRYEGVGRLLLGPPQTDGALGLGRQQQLREQRYRRRGLHHRQGTACHAFLGHRWWHLPRLFRSGQNHYLGRLYLGFRRPWRLQPHHGLLIGLRHRVLLCGVERPHHRKPHSRHRLRHRDHRL
jgi:predicted porin